MKYTAESVLQSLRQVVHPEKGKDIVELGMIQNLVAGEGKISFEIQSPKANDPLLSSIKKASSIALRNSFGGEVENVLSIKVNTPVVTPAPLRTGPLPGVKNIIAIASGKGGVGKSTVAVNLAVALAKTGALVGLLDADVYGPSIPKMFALEGERPEIKNINNKEMMIPIEKYGVKLLSLGFFVNPDDAVVWRGPMATNALKQLITLGDWGELDYLLIDLPPGTGDIHLTMVQEVAVTGAVIVSTPQQVALADVIKGIAMFAGEKINVPVLGLVENMSWFTPAELPENKYFIFGKEGCKQLAQNLGLDLLAQIPLVQSICENGDSGTPAVLNSGDPAGIAFSTLAANLISKIEKRNLEMNPTKKVEITNTDGCDVVKPK
ncbi:MAG: Mrp/NBP35 family ATP-binding protein [Bacteroidales bacterium]|nr:Mrp/NBP35 family ATP-binding protein [Bacteroidales bacterium]MCB9012702.1 Mrp/NBP35 family ATP-binding protein [Bacteroidales bacterium]